MATLEQPAYLGRRQQHLRFEAATELRLPADHRVSAGIVAFQNETHHYYLGTRRSGDRYDVFLDGAFDGTPETIEQVAVDASPGDPLVLEILGNGGHVSFFYRLRGKDQVALAVELDGKLLSTEVAGGFVGTTLGPHVRLEE